MPQPGDTFFYSSGSFSQFDHTSLADAHANWKEWKPLMQSATHLVVLSHILAGANIDFTAADFLSAWICQPKPAHFYLPGYPVLLHSLAARGYEKRQEQNSARGLVYQKIPA